MFTKKKNFRYSQRNDMFETIYINNMLVLRNLIPHFYGFNKKAAQNTLLNCLNILRFPYIILIFSDI